MEAEARNIVYPSIVMGESSDSWPVAAIRMAMELRCGECGLSRECRPKVVDEKGPRGPGMQGGCVHLQACRIANCGQMVV
ncbi:hypothetical protein GF362_04655 [Candidatus Dojkabacteria bacterium]|nr:hypothetical protein [Candidatus Dojkabacteria bacterium]